MTSLSAAVAAALSLIWVDPYSHNKYLPDSFPPGGVATNQVSLSAAIGEIETVSFSIEPKRDMKKVDFISSDLKNGNGDVISGDCADLMLVKVWFRAGGRWTTSWCGRQDKPELINDLILHDDALIKVDEANTNLYLRIDYPDGARYVDIRKGRNSYFDHDLHPVKDAKKFVPFDLKKGRFQQYWLTYRVPKDAKPGVYRGHLSVVEDGRELGKIPTELEIYPFSLPRARTHYDTSKEYLSIWMGTPTIQQLLAGSKQLDVAEEKCRAIYKSLVEHNALNSGSPGDFLDDTTDDLAVRSLLMMREEGMTLKPMVNGAAADFGWAAPVEGPWLSPEGEPEIYQAALDRHAKMVDMHVKVMDKYLGHRECFFSSADECHTSVNQRSYGFWRYIISKGCKTWTDSGVAGDISSIVGINDIPAACSSSEAWNWHNGGSLAVTYAGTFTGPSSPDMWRRQKGLRYYYADFDGEHEYCFFDGRRNRWNDFIWNGQYCQFGIVYFTYDGLISTLAWEGVREGMDDIRYLSLLRMRAEAAMKSSDPKTRALGRKEFLWMDSIDPERVLNLYSFRKEVAQKIITLVKAVGPQPPDPEMPKPPMPLPPCTYGKNPPKDKSMAELAAEYEKNNRYDLAIPVLDKARRDESLPAGIRVNAALNQARLLGEILHRGEAVKVLDETIARPEFSNAQRAKLLMAKANVLMTDMVFEEKFTRPHLDEAATVLEKALKMAGASAEDRYNAIYRMVAGYLAAGEYRAAIDYCDARLADTKFTNAQKADLHLLKADSYEGLKDDKTACRMYDRAHELTPNYNAPEWKSKTLLKEGSIAKRLKDWKRAQRCYGDVLSIYNSEQEDLKNAAKRNLLFVTKQIKDERPASVETIDGAGFDIDLDE